MDNKLKTEQTKDTTYHFQPIESYGIIGNMRTAALVGKNDGSIDWFCYPHFNSPSIFARILDANAGHFSIQPKLKAFQTRQHYLPETNVLVTRFMTKEGVALLTDFMPIISDLEKTETSGWLIRELEVVHGYIHFDIQCFPAFNYARDTHQLKLLMGGNRAAFISKTCSIVLESPDIKLEESKNRKGGIETSVCLPEGSSIVFIIRKYHEDEEKPLGLGCKKIHDCAEILRTKTIDYWHKWLSKCTYKGRWRELVRRSALAMKLMTYEPTGAIVASPTCSLPETIGGKRNWDYRFSWIRDSSFTINAFLKLGLTEEATAYMKFLEARCKDEMLRQKDEHQPPLQVMYSIDGTIDLEEIELKDLSGYKNSRPVRIGNLAINQLQIDIFGELMDCVYMYNQSVTPISYEFWTYLRKIVNWVCDHYHMKDESIWEVRGGRHHFVHSKVMCWVCIDRGIKLSLANSFPADRQKWYKARDDLYEEIMEKGWNPKIGAFTQYYGSSTLDASALYLSVVEFISPTDPRMVSTINAINKTPKQGGLRASSLVYRYDVRTTKDGFSDEEEGTFSICSFWLIEAICRASTLDKKKLMEARLLFEQMLTFSNHLGLFSEELSHEGEMLGNFPQAFTHLALISTAVTLDDTLNKL